jgi:hypothetical protein
MESNQNIGKILLKVSNDEADKSELWSLNIFCSVPLIILKLYNKKNLISQIKIP